MHRYKMAKEDEILKELKLIKFQLAMLGLSFFGLFIWLILSLISKVD